MCSIKLFYVTMNTHTHTLTIEYLTKDFFDISIYETSEKEDFYSRFSTNCSLPTVFSPTPSSQTMFSPSSVDEDAVGKGYLEVYPIHIFGDKPKHNSSIKFNRTVSKLVPSASGESFAAINSDYSEHTTRHRNRLNIAAGQYDSVFFDDDADTCSVFTTMHQPYQIRSKPTLLSNGYHLTNGYHLAPSTNLPLSVKQTVDFDLTKPDQQLTPTIKFGKNSFSYIDQNDEDGECNELKLIFNEHKLQFYSCLIFFFFLECLGSLPVW